MADADTAWGATVLPDGVRFRIWAPDVPSLQLEIEHHPPLDLAPGPEGWYETILSCEAGTRYRYRLPEGLVVPDPASRRQSGDVHGWSVVVDPAAYRWNNTAWQGRPWHEAVVYELHPGAFGGFAGIRGQLPRLRDLGVTMIELMPINDFPGQRNWGYDGVLPYAPDESYGTPEELKALIDAAHGLGIGVMIDVVYNHFGPDGAYLHVYAKKFFNPDRHTPWGAAIDFREPPVARFFIDNALMWLNEYRADGLRFDAVHAYEDDRFIAEMGRAIRAGIAHGRQVGLVLENEDNQARFLPAPFDAQWTDDWHHCLHVLLTGESEGYYAGFQDAAKQLARALSEGFVYQGERTPAGKPRGEPSAKLPPTSFVISLQTHDQVGNRAFGERPSQLADPDALHAATVLLLLSPMIPMLFMGEEWGTKTPFLFFTDHNDELAPLVRDGRRREFAHFASFSNPAKRDMIPDPNDVATYTASIPHPAEAERPDYAVILERTRALLALRQRTIVPGIPGARSAGAEVIGAKAVQARWHLGNRQLLTIAINLDATPVPIALPPGELLYGTGDHLARIVPEGALPEHSAIVYLAEPAP
jgi:maltooligosyltrehalose trehalohydrolase